MRLAGCADGAEAHWSAFGDGIRPDRPLTVSQWAARFRILSREASSEPGPYRIERTPYLRDIADALSPSSPWSEIVFQKSSQVGGSECGFNWIGYVIDRVPGPMMMVQPTIELAEGVSKQRLAPMFRDCPVLLEKLGTGKSRDASNTIREKYFPGGMLNMAGANSAASLASKPIRFLFLDEIDRYPLDVDGEGCPVELATKRTATFARKKIFKNSSPTIKGISKIEAAFESSSRGRFHVPCPFCGHMQHLIWAGIQWDKDPDGKPILSSVRYKCAGCEGEIREHHKTEMLRGGRWVHEDPKANVLGFHINALYSPVGWFSWAAAVDQWHKAQGNPAKLKAFINTVLGETYELRGEDTPQWNAVYTRRESYATTAVPARAALVTAGVDVQKDRIEVTLVGWNRKEAWVVDHITIQGETALAVNSGPWPQLTELLTRDWPHAGGSTVRIARLAIDTGFQTTRVYEWVRSVHALRIAIAIKGSDGLNVPISQPRAIDFRPGDGKRIARGVRLFAVGSSVLKGEILSRFKVPVPSAEQIKALGYPATYLHIPELAEEYCRQITAETEVIRTSRSGREVREWHKTYSRNEALDCLVYAFAAYYELGANRWTDDKWNARLAELGGGIDAREPAPSEPAPAAAAPAPPPPPVATKAAAAPPAPRHRPFPGHW